MTGQDAAMAAALGRLDKGRHPHYMQLRQLDQYGAHAAPSPVLPFLCAPVYDVLSSTGGGM